ncbi:hypothetical protein HK097_005205, partial [Rhizophlyctis rosea]
NHDPLRSRRIQRLRPTVRNRSNPLRRPRRRRKINHPTPIRKHQQHLTNPPTLTIHNPTHTRQINLPILPPTFHQAPISHLRPRTPPRARPGPPPAPVPPPPPPRRR